MCGFAGLLGPNVAGEGVRAALRAMSDALAHRGPDDSGVFAEGPVALAHRRLSILDLSAAGHQPMDDASGRYAMVYNGEIYNHRELRAAHLPGHAFNGDSDSETLLELFARRGPHCFALLNGIFACAIWDRRDRTLVLARDGAGVKPLYVWDRAGKGVGFASEIAALVAHPQFASPLDPLAAARYLTYLYSPGTRTMFADVAKHAAGVWSRYDERGGQIASERFYALPPYAPRAIEPGKAVEATYDRLGEAVGRQMLADVEVGAFLSGGLDSTSIVHFARAHQARRMQCFTIAYDSAGDGEMVADLPYARAAAEHLDVDLHEIAIDAGFAQDLPLLVDMLDEPQADPAALGNFFISRAARDRGIKVLLGGAGGDDVFTGYRRHKQFAHDARVGHIPAFLRKAALGVVEALPSGSGKLRLARKALTGMQGAADERLARAFEWLPAGRTGELLADPPAAADIRRPFPAQLDSLPANWPATERMLRLEQSFFLRDHNLNYTDKTGMAAGVEIRVPFLDPELMNFAATLPLDVKMREGETKWVLRKAMEPHLPHNVIYRPKTGFGVPLREWMAGPMRDMVGDMTSRETLAARGLFDAGAVHALRDAHFAGRVDAAYSLLGVIMCELWCRRFADAR